MCEWPETWKGTPDEDLVYKDMCDENGKEYQYKDRRQELVFIGHKLNHIAIQKLLDGCLLNDDEMVLGPEKWEEIMTGVDKIQMRLEVIDLGEEEGEEHEAQDEDSNEPPEKKRKLQ